MILILTLICLIFGDAFSAPVSEESKAVIEDYENNLYENGDYNFSFKTSNGIRRYENGYVKNTGSVEYVSVSGEYSYVDPDGELVTVRYYADDKGFHIIPPGPQLTVTIPRTSAPPVMPISGILDPHVVASLL